MVFYIANEREFKRGNNLAVITRKKQSFRCTIPSGKRERETQKEHEKDVAEYIRKTVLYNEMANIHPRPKTCTQMHCSKSPYLPKS